MVQNSYSYNGRLSKSYRTAPLSATLNDLKVTPLFYAEYLGNGTT